MDFKQENDKEFNSDLSDKIEDTQDTDIYNDEFYIEEPYDATDQVKKSEKTKSAKSVMFDVLFYVILIFVSIYIIPNFVLQRTVVDGESMENSLSDGDHLYVEKISYRLNLLDRFDVIVFYPYGRDEEEYYVKRIIGLPGETIQIIDNKIYIDGEVLEEGYGKEPIVDPGRANDPILLENDEYFVMGDNRNISKDSRYPTVGNVEKKNIGGKAFLRVSPIKKFGPID